MKILGPWRRPRHRTVLPGSNLSEAAIGVAIRSCPGVQPRRSYSRLHTIIADSASFANSADRFANNFAANAAASVSGGFVAISSASATASPSSSEPGTVRLIKPRRSASLASNVLPVRINSMAALRPTFRGNRWVPPNVGMIPMFISALEKEAFSAARAMWMASTSSHPPPNAKSIDCGNDRFGERFDAPGHLVTGSHKVHHGLGRTGLQVSLERCDIGPGAESATHSATHSCENNRPDGALQFDAVQSGHHGGNQLVAKRVQFLGSVKRKDRDCAPILAQEDGQGLLFSSSIGSHFAPPFLKYHSAPLEHSTATLFRRITFSARRL